MKDPTDREIHWFSRIDTVINKEELDKLIKEVKDPKKGASSEWMAQIIRKADLKKQVMGWSDQKP